MKFNGDGILIYDNKKLTLNYGGVSATVAYPKALFLSHHNQRVGSVFGGCYYLALFLREVEIRLFEEGAFVEIKEVKPCTWDLNSKRRKR